MSAGGLAAAYSASGAAWAAGPSRIYDRLAEVLVGRCPGGVAGRAVLDLGAGTGAASRASVAAGAASVVAVDAAAGMLAQGAGSRPPAAVGDASRLPFATGGFDAVVAAFSLNHLERPVDGLTEAARVLRPGGGLVASAYAADDTHPVKHAVEAASAARGWQPDDWYRRVRDAAMPQLATVDAASAAASTAGLAGAVVEALAVPVDVDADALVAWRLGMAQVAPFVAGLDAGERAELRADATARLGPAPPPLVRSCIVLTWVRP